MEFFEIPFLMKVILCQTALILPYFLLRKTTALSGRRLVLGTILVFPVIIPLSEGLFVPETASVTNYLHFLSEVDVEVLHESPKRQVLSFSEFYGLISVLLFIILLSRIFYIVFQIFRSHPVDGTGRKLRVSKTARSSFSFLSYVVVSVEDAGDEMVIIHEEAHRRQLHSIDKILAEIALCYLWISPASWYLRREIENVHEYLADREVIERFPVADYKQKLFDKALGVNMKFQPVNSFKSKSLKNRFMMMKMKSTAYSGLRFGLTAITGISVFALFGFAANVPMQTRDTPLVFELQGEVEKQPDTYPEYPGGNEAMMNFIMNNLRYPESAMNSGKEGKVIVSFVVNKDGSIKDVKTKKSVDAALDAEAVRVVSSMPKWKPAEKDNKKVNCEMVLPINFVLG